MLGSSFIFNPILWIILLSMSFFGSFLPRDQAILVPAQGYYGMPWEESYETRDWAYDNVDDDIFTLKKHYKFGTDIYVFQATHADILSNQCQDVIFTDEKGNQMKAYLLYNQDRNEVSMFAAKNFYAHTYVCKTAFSDQNGYWEPDPADVKHALIVYLPLEKRTGSEVAFTLLHPDVMADQQSASFIYYVPDANGVPKAVDKVTVTYQYVRDDFTVLSEKHGFD